MSERWQERLVQQFFQEAVQASGPERVGELCSADVVFVAPDQICTGITDLTDYVRGFRRAFEDLTLSTQYILCWGDRAVARLTLRGFHGHAFYGFSATGRRVSIETVFEFRFREHRIRDIRVFYDANTLASELGSPGAAIRARKRGNPAPGGDGNRPNSTV